MLVGVWEEEEGAASNLNAEEERETGDIKKMGRRIHVNPLSGENGSRLDFRVEKKDEQEQTLFNDLRQGIAKRSIKHERLKKGGPSSF